jgi:hypothetical protein
MPLIFEAPGAKTRIAEISTLLAPTLTPSFNNDGELRLANNSYYFDGTKKMKFQPLIGGVYLDQDRVLGGAFTIGIAFAPTDDMTLGLLLGLENTTSAIELGEDTLSIKLDGKISKDATLSNPTPGGFTDQEEIKFIPNELNIIFIQRDSGNRLYIKDTFGFTIKSFTPDSDTTGNFSMNRLGGNAAKYFTGYIAEILIEESFMTQLELRNVARQWIGEYYYPPVNFY